jgi:hypothetical protein
MKTLPQFSIDQYRAVLAALDDAGYGFRPITDVTADGQVCYLRHDIDCFLEGWEAIPRLEAEYFAPTTYYFLMNEYNMLSVAGRKTVALVLECGHEIGLHIDGESYPKKPELARDRCDFERAVLEDLIGQEIRTVSFHNVHKKVRAALDLREYVDPYSDSFLKGMSYISDSVRAWRDESLLNCFGTSAPQRLQLLTHPELWLDGEIEDRITYLERVIFPRMVLGDNRRTELLALWQSHPAALLHNKRMLAGATP